MKTSQDQRQKPTHDKKMCRESKYLTQDAHDLFR